MASRRSLAEAGLAVLSSPAGWPLVALLAALSACAWTAPAGAHTVTYGYVPGIEPGVYTFWFRAHHAPTEANFTKGSVSLACDGGYAQTSPLSRVVTEKPSGLVDGNSSRQGAGDIRDGSGPALVWQGATFTNISNPGTCRFTYIPVPP
jgi:hypothetical protein